MTVLWSEKQKKPKRVKFNYEKMKQAATNSDRTTRKKVFIEYFESFQEFPSYLFDNSEHIDALLEITIDDLLKDPASSKELLKGVALLLERLPARRS